MQIVLFNDVNIVNNQEVPSYQHTKRRLKTSNTTMVGVFSLTVEEEDKMAEFWGEQVSFYDVSSHLYHNREDEEKSVLTTFNHLPLSQMGLTSTLQSWNDCLKPAS